MKLFRSITVLLLCACSLPASAALNVLATVPEWAALAEAIGGTRVRVSAATHGLQDPHRIDARPSLIARARNAQLLLATGAELEAGWLPLLLRESGNRAIQPGQAGYFEASSAVSLLGVPSVLDRAHGDVHAAGNPHIQTDPRRILQVAEALTERLVAVDPQEAMAYRQGLQEFSQRWRSAMARWQQQAAPLRGTPVLVQHAAFPYLNDWLGLVEVGVLEPKPGIEPSASHLASLLAQQRQQPAKMVLRPAYQHEAPSRWIAERAGIPAVVLPFTIGGSPEASDLYRLFDETIARLLQALPPR